MGSVAIARSQRSRRALCPGSSTERRIPCPASLETAKPGKSAGQLARGPEAVRDLDAGDADVQPFSFPPGIEDVQEEEAAGAHEPGRGAGEPGEIGRRVETGEGGDQAVERPGETGILQMVEIREDGRDRRRPRGQPREHAGRQIAGGDRDAAVRQVERVEAGAGGDVEHPRAGGEQGVETLPKPLTDPGGGRDRGVVPGRDRIVGAGGGSGHQPLRVSPPPRAAPPAATG